MTQSTQRITWQISSEYCRLVAPSGRTLNYILFTEKMQILEIFGSPLVHAAAIWRTNGEAWEPSKQCCFREWWLGKHCTNVLCWS